LSAMLPLLLLAYAKAGLFRGAGRLFRAGCLTIVALFAAAWLALPGPQDVGDVVGGAFLLMTAILLFHVFWSLLAWGFTVTLLTALAAAAQPLTLEQWASAYMQGGDLSGFAHNRLSLLIGSGTAVSRNGQVVVTPLGMLLVRVVRLIRFSTGMG
jgi:hypothetical protein